MKKYIKSNEGVLSLVIIALCIVFTIVNPSFFTLSTLFTITRAGIVNSIFAICVLMIMITGGIDLSFMAIASFVSYLVTSVIVGMGAEPPLILIFVIVFVLGAVIGTVNACLTTWLNLPTFIITLAMQNVLRGALLAFVGTSYISVLPLSMQSLSTSFLMMATAADGKTYGLNSAILLVVVIYVAVALMLRYTMLGRKMYCLGGDVVAAQRIGINVLQTRILVYGLAGGIAAIAGTLHTSLLRFAAPGDLIGNELLVIAAVVLGGASKAEGRGTVFGTLLGVLLITIINNSLTMLRVPSFWQQAVLGIIIIVGTVIQFARNSKSKIV